MKIRKTSILISLLAIVLTACDFGSTSNSDSLTDSETSESETSSGTSSSTGSSESGYTVQFYYEHVWNATSDFGSSNKSNVSGGTVTIDGLTWTYSDFIFINQDSRGLQIGSKNNTQSTPWTISTNFGETVILKDITINLCGASGGSGTYSIGAGSSTVGSGSYSTTNTDYTYEGLSLETDSFSVTLTASSNAIFFYSISFTVWAQYDTKLSFGSRSEVGETIDPSVSPRDAVVPGQNSVPSTKYSVPTDVSTYYSSITLTDTGTTLEKELHDLISDMTKYSYGDARYMLLYTDEAYYYPGYVYGLYDGDLIPAVWDYGGTWNREHTWPRSFMGGIAADNNVTSMGSDLHNLRASCVSSNSARGNSYFDNVTSGDRFYPNVSSLSGNHRYEGDHRGDVARICFYMYVRYGRYDDEATLNLSDNPSGSYTMGILSTLLTWNQEDPVDAFETQRNNRIYEYQGNRNPFIDYPELANNLFN